MIKAKKLNILDLKIGETNGGKENDSDFFAFLQHPIKKTAGCAEQNSFARLIQK